MNQEKQDKKQDDVFLNLLSGFAWWKLDYTELEEQVNKYSSLGVTKSVRGISVLLILGSLILTTVAAIIGWVSVADVVGSAIIYLPISFFIYRGKRWAMLLMLALWTVEKVFTAVDFVSLTPNSTLSLSSVLLILFWWSLPMRYFYAAFKVEGIRNRRVTIITPIAPTEQQKIIPDVSKTALTETTPKITRSFKGVRWDRRILYVLVPVLLLGSAFYWFEVRPARIRHDCSWKKVHIAAIEARAARGPEVCITDAYNLLQGIKIENPKMCPGSPAISAQPARDEWHRVLGDEYTFCLHDHGL